MSNSSILCADLVGSDTCAAAGITAQATAPVLALCRKLIAAGYDPATALHCYREETQTLCLVINSIAAAAALEINGDGDGFRPLRQPAPASPARLNAARHDRQPEQRAVT